MSILSSIGNILTGKAIKGAVQQKGGKLYADTVPLGGSTLSSVGSKVGSVLKSLIPATTKGKVLAVASAPVVYGILKENPKAPVQLGSQLSKLGSDIGIVSKTPSKETAKNVFTNSPVLTSLIGLGIVGTGAKYVLPSVGGFLNTQAIKNNTEVLMSKADGSNYIPQAISSPVMGGAKGDKIPSSPSLPTQEASDVTTPLQEITTIPEEMEAQGVSDVPKRKRRKARKEPMRQTISQRVDVRVNAGNKRYINQLRVRT